MDKSMQDAQDSLIGVGYADLPKVKDEPRLTVRLESVVDTLLRCCTHQTDLGNKVFGPTPPQDVTERAGDSPNKPVMPLQALVQRLETLSDRLETGLINLRDRL